MSSLRFGGGTAGSRAPLSGLIELPGDKSISHRALILGALAPGTSRVTNLNTGEDVLATGRALSALGATTRIDEALAEAEVEGCGPAGLVEPDDVIDCGNSGSTLRMLLGVCACVPGLSVLTGDPSLRRRPMLRVVDPLRHMGAAIDGRDGGERAPLVVRGGHLRGVDVAMTVASAQVKTALLLAGLGAAGTTTILQPKPSRDHTERMLAAAGAGVVIDGLRITVDGRSTLPPVDRVVPGDVSAAAFFGVAAALVEGSNLTVDRVGLNPTRTAWIGALARMGADITTETATGGAGEPEGRIRIRSSTLRATEISGEQVAYLIDEIPILAVAATRARGTTVIRDAGELRVKESDRIATMAAGLTTLGARVEELPDGMAVHGPATLRGGRVDSMGDHRAAMAFAVAGLVATDPVEVAGWSSVATSFPGFLDILAAAQGKPA